MPTDVSVSNFEAAVKLLEGNESSIFGRSSIKDLLYFLEVSGHQTIAVGFRDQIEHDYSIFRYSEEMPDRDSESEDESDRESSSSSDSDDFESDFSCDSEVTAAQFDSAYGFSITQQEMRENLLQLIIMKSPEIFEIHTSGVLFSSYSLNRYVENIKLCKRYIKFVNKVCASLGYLPIVYDTSLFDEISSDDDKQIAARLVTQAEQLQDNPFSVFYAYRYLETQPLRQIETAHDETKQHLHNKQKLKNIKKFFSYLLIVVSAIIGIGEGFAPFKFYLGMLFGLGFTTQVSFLVASIAFFSAFSVNLLLFYTDSYITFKDIFFKNRLFKDSKGNRLKWYEITRNLFVMLLSFCSALMLASMSFYFSGFATGIALFVSSMTLIGFFSVLFNATKIWNLSTLLKVLNYLKDLIYQPVKEIFTPRSLLSIPKNIFILAVNVLALVVIVGLSITIIASTATMFFSSLVTMPLLAFLTPQLIGLMIGVGEFALGTFFILNISNVVNAMRMALLNELNLPSFGDNTVRRNRIIAGMAVGTALISLVLINVGGYAIGYMGSLISNSVIISLLSLGGMIAPVMGLAVVCIPAIILISLGLSLIATHAFPALTTILAPPAFYKYRYEDLVIPDLSSVQPDDFVGFNTDRPSIVGFGYRNGLEVLSMDPMRSSSDHVMKLD